ncbi:hypothetical protein ASPZODRAFT_132262 [Penicilliopsis zonata CBS 506.65]|uniref:MARVEL domain-containing protein n=1 Tax=Penicilliopsis zonata CBS 506.65 TaxID=1073090 RepID=A0A1L9SJA5_9EURO|nr:hypothetical protein ASPZODRAFT_132262 [Penicilliopsis zonata CBS 506.65]OJJ47278.1 hypothetical protein ASPZODRAFT_132262 [Penicilliopsis zonata CBS 506.65]
MAASQTVNFTLRALQLIFAIAIMGTDGYAINSFRSYSSYEDSWFGDLYLTTGVPDAWGFLMFCAAWTFLVVLLPIIAGRTRFVDHIWMGYIYVVGEAVAVLSWLAGFIAVAVNIGNDVCPAGGSDVCPSGHNCCAVLKAATVFGACEWLLFMITTALTVLVFRSTRQPKTEKTTPATAT